jgi:hypothetical protein
MFWGLLLMAVLAVGAVSASEDVAGDQNLTLADESSDVLEESVNEEPEILEYYQVMEDDVFVTIYETYFACCLTASEMAKDFVLSQLYKFSYGHMPVFWYKYGWMAK